MKKICFILSFIFLISCSDNYPENVRIALDKAGSNKKELEKVVRHFKEVNDTLKVNAAFFLIANMDNHYSYKGDLVNAYDKIFEYATLKRKEKETYIAWDSLEKAFIGSSSGVLIKAPDLLNVSSKYLIDNIDLAFSEWKKPMARNLNFAEFCEFILPYRIADEPLDDWRSMAALKFKGIADSAQRTFQENSGCDLINDELKKNFLIGSVSPVNCPYTFRLKDIMMLQTGACDDASKLTARVMRAVGIPVGIDFIPNWGNSDQGHSWNVFLNEHRTIPFMGTESNPGLTKLGYVRKNTIFRKMPKVYRNTFANQTLEKEFLLRNHNDVPDLFLNINMIDVTREYMPVANIRLKLKNPDKSVSVAYLCIFDNKDWKAVHYGDIRDGEVLFTDMGKGIVYLPMYYKDGDYFAADDPLILDNRGGVIKLNADTAKKITVKLFRKYPEDASNLIEPGDTYELFYWNNSWKSLGKQSAKINYLIYTNVPSNSLLLLSDLSKGKQERIFTYNNNQQIWW